MNAIEIQALHKRFGSKRVLDGVELAVPAEGIVGFVGPNGAGKSTCLRILIGLTPRDQGRVQVLGMDPRRDSMRIRKHSCYLPGETSVYGNMRGADFLDFAWSLYPERQDDVLELFHDEYQLPLRRRVHTYSAGMKQKLALLATLVPDVALYILDEPDRALDATARFVLRDAIRLLRTKGKTVLLSSHHLGEVETLADDLRFLLHGRIVPDAELQAARARLSRQLRLRLKPGHQLPPGAELLREEPGGDLILQPQQPPLQWLAQLPEGAVHSATVGVVRLEDLYRNLLLDEEPEPQP